MNRRLKYVPMLCVCLIGMLVSCGTVKRTSGVSGNKAVVEEKDPLTPEQRRKYDYFFLEALRMKEKVTWMRLSKCIVTVWTFIHKELLLYSRFPGSICFSISRKRGGGFEEGSGCRP